MADAPERFIPGVGLEHVEQHSTLEVVSNVTNDSPTSNGYYGPEKVEAVHQEELKSDKKRRICGMPKKIAIILGVILLLLVIIGAVVGGVVGSKKKKTSDTPIQAVEGSKTSASDTSGTTAPPSSLLSTATSASSSAASSSSAPAIVVPSGESFDSGQFHQISTFGSSIIITHNSTKAGRDARNFAGIAGAVPSGEKAGTVSIVTLNQTDDVQRWHIKPADSSWVPDAALFATYAKPPSLVIITLQRYGPPVRLALNGQTPDAIPTLSERDNSQTNQFWYIERIEEDIVGDYGRFMLHNYQAGNEWHMAIGEKGDSKKLPATLEKGTVPQNDNDLWQILETHALNDEERERWGTTA